MSERNLYIRIAYHLRKNKSEFTLCTVRTPGARERLGHYYLVNDEDRIVRTHLDLEAYACELGILKDGEKLKPVSL